MDLEYSSLKEAWGQKNSLENLNKKKKSNNIIKKKQREVNII